MHPDLETLIRSRDGELADGRERQVQAHLEGCGECRLHLHRLKQEVAPRIPAEPGPFILAGIRAKIRNWEAQRSSEQWTQGLKTRVARQIGPFLGSRGADCVLQPVSQDGENLLCAIEPVLAEFLGSRAASSLVGRVVDAAL